jgi:hypothetical protein
MSDKGWHLQARVWLKLARPPSQLASLQQKATSRDASSHCYRIPSSKTPNTYNTPQGAVRAGKHYLSIPHFNSILLLYSSLLFETSPSHVSLLVLLLIVVGLLHRMTADLEGPITLLDLLSNSLVLYHTVPYLSASALTSLSATSSSFHSLTRDTPGVFRYLDLSIVTSAATLPKNWADDQDSFHITEEEWITRPLRRLFGRLERAHILQDVHTLILDGLSVSAELISTVITEESYNVRILSIRDVRDLNDTGLVQTLKYTCRPTRIADPKLKALYLFGHKDSEEDQRPLSRHMEHLSVSAVSGVTETLGAQIGSDVNHRSQQALAISLAQTGDRWYAPSGAIPLGRQNDKWAQALQACNGVLAFDAVLCRGPKHSHLPPPQREGEDDVAFAHRVASHRPLPPAIANIALGPSGCACCHSTPEDAAYYGDSPTELFPLLAPPPIHSSTVRAAKQPSSWTGSKSPRLIVRCEACVRDRWCRRCKKWWCEDCYVGQSTMVEMNEMGGNAKGNIKVYADLCVEGCLVGEMMTSGLGGMWG